MRRGQIIGAVLLALACAIVFAGAASAATPAAPEGPYPPAGFKLRGSHGWSIAGAAYVREGSGRGTFSVSASRGNESASYSAPAKVTADSIRANLGSLGRVDLTLHLTGEEKTTHVGCSSRPETYEAGTYEGIFEFHGEGGYTAARATRLAGVSELALLAGSNGCRGTSTGGAFGFGLPGAMLKGISYAHGRTLKFQLNKNRPGAQTLYTASLAERRDGIKIYRELTGTAPASAFRYDARVRTATVSPPAPFSGSAHVSREADAVSPLIAGDLTLAFPGHTVPLAGPEVHVSLEHARITHGEHGNASIGF